MPVLAAIGAAVSLASAIAGAIGSSSANRKASKLIQQEQDESKAWYERKLKEDYTTRSDFQAILKKQRELLDEQYRNTRGVNAVAGGTEESVALQKQKANESLADTMTNEAGKADAYKDSLEAQQRQENAAYTQQKVAIKQKQAESIAQAAGQGISAGLNMIGSSAGTGSASGNNAGVNGYDYDAFNKINA